MHTQFIDYEKMQVLHFIHVTNPYEQQKRLLTEFGEGKLNQVAGHAALLCLSKSGL